MTRNDSRSIAAWLLAVAALVFAMVILGGMGSIPGAIIGASVVTILNLQVLKGISLWLNELRNSGMEILGYNLATLSILSPAKIATALLVLAVPILDGIWIVIGRLRQGRSPFHGDRSHLHFRLSDRGISTRRIVLGYYSAAVAFGLVAVLAAAPLVKFVLLVLLGTAVLVLLAWLARNR